MIFTIHRYTYDNKHFLPSFEYIYLPLDCTQILFHIYFQSSLNNIVEQHVDFLPR